MRRSRSRTDDRLAKLLPFGGQLPTTIDRKRVRNKGLFTGHTVQGAQTERRARPGAQHMNSRRNATAASAQSAALVIRPDGMVERGQEQADHDGIDAAQAAFACGSRRKSSQNGSAQHRKERRQKRD
jgi:hypothetical protein